MLVVEIIGCLGSDAIIKDFNGQKYLAFNVAHSENFKDANGNKVEKTVWISCLKKGDGTLGNYLKKGTKVFIRGNISTKIYYLTNNNMPQIAHNCQVHELQLLSAAQVQTQQTAPPTEEELQQRRQEYQQTYQQKFEQQKPLETTITEPQEDDDLPF